MCDHGADTHENSKKEEEDDTGLCDAHCEQPRPHDISLAAVCGVHALFVTFCEGKVEVEEKKGELKDEDNDIDGFATFLDVQSQPMLNASPAIITSAGLVHLMLDLFLVKGGLVVQRSWQVAGRIGRLLLVANAIWKGVLLLSWFRSCPVAWIYLRCRMRNLCANIGLRWFNGKQL